MSKYLFVTALALASLSAFAAQQSRWQEPQSGEQPGLGTCFEATNTCESSPFPGHPNLTWDQCVALGGEVAWQDYATGQCDYSEPRGD
jgi:hypothetical protein